MAQLSGQLNYYYELDKSTSATVKGSTPANFGKHKMVIAIAALNSMTPHKVGGGATVGFTEYVKGGQAINMPPQGTLIASDVSDLDWEFTVNASHAMACVLIQTYD
jgi:hypothetical protein